MNAKTIQESTSRGIRPSRQASIDQGGVASGCAGRQKDRPEKSRDAIRADLAYRRDDLAKLRASCDRLHNGSCSPCKFDCPLYRNGKCLDPIKEEV